MVLKKTNCHNINSGNTLKKCYFNQTLKISDAKKCHAIKVFLNIPYAWSDDGILLDNDPTEDYLDDGGMSRPSAHRYNTYSLNKKKRWLLENEVVDTIRGDALTEADFKLTLVHRSVPDHLIYNDQRNNYTVLHYYDSRYSKSMVISTSGACSSRHSLLQKVFNSNRETVNPHQKKSLERKKWQCHNQHFRDVQRKTPRPWREDHRSQNDEAPPDGQEREIRYEIGEPANPTSAHYRYRNHDYRYWYYERPPGTRFRRSHCEKVEWYYPWYEQNGPVKRSVESISGYRCEDFGLHEEVEVDDSIQEGPLRHCTFSLLDLAHATENGQQRWKRRTHHATPYPGKSPVNSCSDQLVKKHGKDAVIYINHDMNPSEDVDRESPDPDTDHVSVVHSSNLTDSTVGDNEEKITCFDESYSSCLVPDGELSVTYLTNLYGDGVEFGKCVPFTVQVHLQAVWLQRQETEQDKGQERDGIILQDWWLLCQKGDAAFMEDLHLGSAPPSDMALAKLRLHSNLGESEVDAANHQLKQLLLDGDGRPAIMTLHDLLGQVCDLVAHLSVILPKNTLNTGKPLKKIPKSLEGHLPHEHFTGQVEVCSVTEAFHYLQAAHTPSQTSAGDDDLSLSFSMTWCDLQCSVCFSPCHDTSNGLCPFVVMTVCGHSFCRQCWQYYLLASVRQGQTTLYCMEFKCETTLDSVMLMSLVPQSVYSRWQQRLHNKVVESSGQWKWCPNSRCGQLAKTHPDREMEKQEKKRGVPVVCKCHKRWCLDCGRDEHWPITCIQFMTYTKMLKQNGEEEGPKSSAVEITSVKVKRCPACRYPMEKSGGCSHMTCSQCRSDFCWECLANWSDHTGTWQGCQQRGEEVISLENSKIYPLPIECYKKAVSYRHTWKQINKVHWRTVSILHSIYASLIRKKGKDYKGLSPDSVSRVIDAFIFSKTGNRLMELSFILLSNCPRRHHLARQLRGYLQLLEFSCDCVARYLQRPVKVMLTSTESLHTMTTSGNRLIRIICRIAHRLTSSLHGKTAHDWLFDGDLERFVKYK